MADLDRLELDHARGFDTSSTMPPVKLNTEASRLPRHAQAQGQQSAVGFHPGRCETQGSQHRGCSRACTCCRYMNNGVLGEGTEAQGELVADALAYRVSKQLVEPKQPPARSDAAAMSKFSEGQAVSIAHL